MLKLLAVEVLPEEEEEEEEEEKKKKNETRRKQYLAAESGKVIITWSAEKIFRIYILYIIFQPESG